MIKSIEARDPYTYGHSRRVSQYATIIARAMRLGEREIEKIGTLHFFMTSEKSTRSTGRFFARLRSSISKSGRS
jgi:hypothetical protein